MNGKNFTNKLKKNMSSEYGSKRYNHEEFDMGHMKKM